MPMTAGRRGAGGCSSWAKQAPKHPSNFLVSGRTASSKAMHTRLFTASTSTSPNPEDVSERAARAGEVHCMSCTRVAQSSTKHPERRLHPVPRKSSTLGLQPCSTPHKKDGDSPCFASRWLPYLARPFARNVPAIALSGLNDIFSLSSALGFPGRLCPQTRPDPFSLCPILSGPVCCTSCSCAHSEILPLRH